MSVDKPDYHDADLIIKLYDLRREPLMRQSRDAINGKFWPKSYDDVAGLMDMAHPMNAAFRQTSSYWEMVYGMVKHGVLNPDLMMESNGEGLLLLAKIWPYLSEIRKNLSPTAFTNTEWIAKNTSAGKERFELIQKRVAQMSATMK